MIPELVAILGAVTLFCEEGIASQYAPGVMERVIAVRQTPGRAWPELPPELPVVSGYLAARHCADVGQVWWVCHEDTCEQFLVADCAGHADGGYDWMIRNGIVAEVDFETAQRWNVVGRGAKVRICPM